MTVSSKKRELVEEIREPENLTMKTLQTMMTCLRRRTLEEETRLLDQMTRTN